nr:uncharacterized protein LOC129276826 [Lytechinus pictus]
MSRRFGGRIPFLSRTEVDRYDPIEDIPTFYFRDCGPPVSRASPSTPTVSPYPSFMSASYPYDVYHEAYYDHRNVSCPQNIEPTSPSLSSPAPLSPSHFLSDSPPPAPVSTQSECYPSYPVPSPSCLESPPDPSPTPEDTSFLYRSDTDSSQTSLLSQPPDPFHSYETPPFSELLPNTQCAPITPPPPALSPLPPPTHCIVIIDAENDNPDLDARSPPLHTPVSAQLTPLDQPSAPTLSTPTPSTPSSLEPQHLTHSPLSDNILSPPPSPTLQPPLDLPPPPSPQPPPPPLPPPLPPPDPGIRSSPLAPSQTELDQGLCQLHCQDLDPVTVSPKINCPSNLPILSLDKFVRNTLTNLHESKSIHGTHSA